MKRNDDGVDLGDSIHHDATGRNVINGSNKVEAIIVMMSLIKLRLLCHRARKRAVWSWALMLRSGLWVTIAINYAWVSECVGMCVCVGFLPVLSVHVFRGLLCQIVRPAAGCLIDSGVNVIVPVCLSCCRSCNCLPSDWASPPLSPSHANFHTQDANPGKTRYCILIRFMFGWWR